MEALLTVIFIVVAIAVIAGLVQGSLISKKQKAMENALKQLANFHVSQQVFGCDGFTGIAIDECCQKVCLLSIKNGLANARVYSFRQIYSAELFEDGNSVTKTSRTSQIGGAAIGGLLFGGVGAIIGGLSGKTETAQEVSSIELRIIVDEINEPLHDVKFLNSKSKKDGGFYKLAMPEARKWHGIVSVLIKRAESLEQRGAEGKAPLTATNSEEATTECLYTLIGLPPTATQKEIHEKCLELGQKLQSQVNEGDPRATALFSRIEDAYDVLGDPIKRSNYDSTLPRAH